MCEIVLLEGLVFLRIGNDEIMFNGMGLLIYKQITSYPKLMEAGSKTLQTIISTGSEFIQWFDPTTDQDDERVKVFYGHFSTVCHKKKYITEIPSSRWVEIGNGLGFIRTYMKIRVYTLRSQL